MLLTDRLLLEQVGLKLFERKLKFISFCQASEKKKHIEKSPIFVQNLDFFGCCYCSLGEKGHSRQAIKVMIINLKVKMAEIPIQFLVRLHFFHFFPELTQTPSCTK